MADGKDRAKSLSDFDAWVNAPIQGWDAADRQLNQALNRSRP